MPSNVTQNYQLSQWSKDDQVKMEDFNADNAKIETALTALEDSKAKKADLTALQTQVAAAPYVKLLEVVTTEAKTQIDLDVSQFDLTKFQKLELHVFGQLNAGGSAGVVLRLNEHAADYFYNSNYSTTGNGINLSSVTFTSNPGGGHFTLYLFGPHIMCVPHGTSWDSSTVYFTRDTASAIRSSVLSTAGLHTLNLIVSQGVGAEARTLMPGARIVLTGLKL